MDFKVFEEVLRKEFEKSNIRNGETLDAETLREIIITVIRLYHENYSFLK